MRVLVNALPLRRGGGVTYLEQQLAAIQRVRPDIELHTLIAPYAEIDSLPGVVETVAVKHVHSRFAYEQIVLPLRRRDILYCPANFGPVLSSVPMVLTIHNAHYYRSGRQLAGTRALRPVWKVMANHLAMRAADAVIAISRSQAVEAVASVPSIGARTKVIHSGFPEWPSEANTLEGLPDRYVLSIANSAPHKRVEDVVQGWATAPGVPSKLALVLIGSVTEDQARRYREIAGPHQSRLVVLGPVRDRTLMKSAYEQATALVSMSVLESFPLTPVEAGSLGCPVVLSDIPSHREVTCGNGVFVAPRSPDDLARVLRSEVILWEPGSAEWKWPHTWDDNASELCDVFDRVVAPVHKAGSRPRAREGELWQREC